RVHDNILPLRVLVAGDDLVLRDLAVDGACFLVLDAAVAVFVQLIQVNFGAAGRGGGRLDGDGDEAELEKAPYGGTGSHGCSPGATVRIVLGRPPRGARAAQLGTAGSPKMHVFDCGPGCLGTQVGTRPSDSEAQRHSLDSRHFGCYRLFRYLSKP